MKNSVLDLGDKENYAQVWSFEDWKNLPEMERYQFKWYLPYLLYKYPYGLTWEDWTEFNSYIKSEHPVQFFFRHTLENYLYKWEGRFKSFYYKTKHLMKRPRSEMRNVVFPAAYHDLPQIIDTFHIEVIKEFVDREKCLEYNDYTDKAGKKFKKELLAHYAWATKGRNEILLENSDPSDIKDFIKKTKKLRAGDEKLAVWVIKNRERLWV